MARGQVKDTKKIKLRVGGAPKQVFEENVDLIDLKDLKREADGTYTYSLPMDR